ncbi:MAG: nucleotidyltransferase family protein [Planctomycetes bacterium]|nr:nucleotidyltransferase family protein [Planctomycetota bacterium]
MTAPATALVIAGGQGTRMASSYADLAKPLVRVHGVPLIAHVFRSLRRHGVNEVYLALRHRGAQLETFVREHLTTGFAAVHFLHEDEPLGTIGSRALLPDAAGAVLVQSGALLSGIDLTELGRVHHARGADLTIATHWERPRLELGEVLTDDDERVTGYLEKPVKRYRISSGTYIVGPAARRLLGAPRWLPFPELVQMTLAAGLAVRAHDHGAPWIDVNTPEQATAAESMLADDPIGFGMHPEELRDATLRWGIAP